MTTSTRFTVSVPTRILEALDEQLVKNGDSRSAVVCRLIQEAIHKAEEQADIERYIRGWQENPMTAEDVLWDEQTAAQRLAEHPW